MALSKGLSLPASVSTYPHDYGTGGIALHFAVHVPASLEVYWNDRIRSTVACAAMTPNFVRRCLSTLPDGRWTLVYRVAENLSYDSDTDESVDLDDSSASDDDTLSFRLKAVEAVRLDSDQVVEKRHIEVSTEESARFVRAIEDAVWPIRR